MGIGAKRTVIAGQAAGSPERGGREAVPEPAPGPPPGRTASMGARQELEAGAFVGEKTGRTQCRADMRHSDGLSCALNCPPEHAC